MFALNLLYSKVSDWNSEVFHLMFLVEFFCWWFIIRTYLIFTSVPPEYFLSCIHSDLEYPWGCVRWLCVCIFPLLCFQPYFSAWNQTQCHEHLLQFLRLWVMTVWGHATQCEDGAKFGNRERFMNAQWLKINLKLVHNEAEPGSACPVFNCYFTVAFVLSIRVRGHKTAHATCNADICMLPETPHF